MAEITQRQLRPNLQIMVPPDDVWAARRMIHDMIFYGRIARECEKVCSRIVIKLTGRENSEMI